MVCVASDGIVSVADVSAVGETRGCAVGTGVWVGGEDVSDVLLAVGSMLLAGTVGDASGERGLSGKVAGRVPSSTSSRGPRAGVGVAGVQPVPMTTIASANAIFGNLSLRDFVIYGARLRLMSIIGDELQNRQFDLVRANCDCGNLQIVPGLSGCYNEIAHDERQGQEITICAYPKTSC